MKGNKKKRMIKTLKKGSEERMKQKKGKIMEGMI